MAPAAGGFNPNSLRRKEAGSEFTNIREKLCLGERIRRIEGSNGLNSQSRVCAAVLSAATLWRLFSFARDSSRLYFYSPLEFSLREGGFLSMAVVSFIVLVALVESTLYFDLSVGTTARRLYADFI